MSYAIARNQSEIWLEIRNQGLENPVEIRKSARNHEKSGKKAREIRKSSRSHERNTPFLSEHAQSKVKSQKFIDIAPCEHNRYTYIH